MASSPWRPRIAVLLERLGPDGSRLTHQPQLWLVLGGNGAGKSTFHRLALEACPDA